MEGRELGERRWKGRGREFSPSPPQSPGSSIEKLGDV